MNRLQNRVLEQTIGTPARWEAPFTAQRQRSADMARDEYDPIQDCLQ